MINDRVKKIQELQAESEALEASRRGLLKNISTLATKKDLLQDNVHQYSGKVLEYGQNLIKVNRYLKDHYFDDLFKQLFEGSDTEVEFTPDDKDVALNSVQNAQELLQQYSSQLTSVKAELEKSQRDVAAAKDRLNTIKNDIHNLANFMTLYDYSDLGEWYKVVVEYFTINTSTFQYKAYLKTYTINDTMDCYYLREDRDDDLIQDEKIIEQLVSILNGS